MTDQNLRELLDKLHQELEQLDTTDEQGRAMLHHLDADIRTLLKRSGEPAEADEPMLEQLQDTINHFETTHPSLTLTLSQMMTILSNAGI
jgi:ABC-type transporter Mla subunit MlaD